jgi:hypothetical protein
MAYKIVWRSGGETAERYATKSIAGSVLKKSGLTGKIVKTKLGNPGRTSPFSEFMFGDDEVKNYPLGKKLKWIKSPTGVYRTHI